MGRARKLGTTFDESHNFLRNQEGLQPAEALDELVKLLLCREYLDATGELLNLPNHRPTQETLDNSIRHFGLEDYKIGRIQLSETSISKMWRLLEDANSEYGDLDLGSHALRSFIGRDSRRGLGIFLTPENLVGTIIDYVGTSSGARVLDLAAGSGTFLKVFLQRQPRDCSIVVAEKNPKLMLLARINLIPFEGSAHIDYRVIDSLHGLLDAEKFDIIVTNPPFGVSTALSDDTLSGYQTVTALARSSGFNSIPSELLFLEKCFKLLKPGGRLAIVLPKSIATNISLQAARESLGQYGFIDAILTLPPETFALTGTQVSTIVIFARKYKQLDERYELGRTFSYNCKSVGYDSTGRSTGSGDLQDFLLCKESSKSLPRDITDRISYDSIMPRADSFARLSDICIDSRDCRSSQNRATLSDFCTLIRTGRTPARSKYTDAGFFLIKVGNLTGSGIDWCPRDRNFIPEDEMLKRMSARNGLILQENDILLTSSAHNSSYIAKKIDILSDIPDFVDMPLSYVGEVMLIRPDPLKVDPFKLLAYLRLPSVGAQLRGMVRGQTAHLHSADVESLPVNEKVLLGHPKIHDYASLALKGSELSKVMSELTYQQRNIATVIEDQLMAS
jgi:type I restriction enzyme M protein